jgi:hypothetical protein
VQAEYNKLAIEFLKYPFKVQRAPTGVKAPEKNELFGTLYEAIQEFLIEEMPQDDKYDDLYEWAIHLTKCDEVAAYILGPCFRSIATPNFEYGLLIWSFGLRKSYWIKDDNPNSGAVLFQGDVRNRFLLNRAVG